MTTGGDELRNAYEGLEAHFPDAAARERYRTSMLEKTREQADFLAARIAEASALEIGCGNGRLLIELARRGRLHRGTGVDLAHSRIEFARRWAEDLGLEGLHFEAADALAMELRDRHDAIICITGAFAYFDPLAPGSSAELAARWAGMLHPGGLLVLELYPHPREAALLAAAGGVLRLWRELGPDDPWRYYLSDLRLESRVLVHGKTFIHRTTGEVDSGRRERIRLYDENEVRALLTGAGLVEIEIWEGWSEVPYRGGEAMVITARRAAAQPRLSSSESR